MIDQASAKLKTYNVGLTNVRCQTVIIGPGMCVRVCACECVCVLVCACVCVCVLVCVCTHIENDACIVTVVVI